LSLLSKRNYLIVFIFFLGVLSLLYYTFFTPNYYEGESPKRFEISKGESFNEITERLYEEKIIPSKINFKIAGFIYGAEKKIRAARFHIPNSLSYLDLIDFFIEGKADFLRPVYIRDGLSTGWLAYKLKLDALIDSTDFVALASDRYFLDSIGIEKNSLEGYLMPGSYEIYERSPAAEVIDTLFSNFKRFMTDTLIQRADSIGLSVHEALTLASIIKGETNIAEEMPVVSGVYHNRLKIGMKLQADPTVQYLLPGGWRRLLYQDLQIDSPYNTYKYPGLPPGPINNPGRAAILAALYPKEHNYLFFVADGKGGHLFAKNYSEHLHNVREYRRLINQKK
jgi:UPF0755 protein